MQHKITSEKQAKKGEGNKNKDKPQSLLFSLGTSQECMLPVRIQRFAVVELPSAFSQTYDTHRLTVLPPSMPLQWFYAAAEVISQHKQEQPFSS